MYRSSTPLASCWCETYYTKLKKNHKKIWRSNNEIFLNTNQFDQWKTDSQRGFNQLILANLQLWNLEVSLIPKELAVSQIVIVTAASQYLSFFLCFSPHIHNAGSGEVRNMKYMLTLLALTQDVISGRLRPGRKSSDTSDRWPLCPQHQPDWVSWRKCIS